jgi:hypothetical protein
MNVVFNCVSVFAVISDPALMGRNLNKITYGNFCNANMCTRM